jgi:sensor histidine kinase YesM
MTDDNIDTELNDRTIRIVMIPFFGIVIPNVTGMIDNAAYSPLQLAWSYFYFIFISFAIWHGNRYLLFRLRIRFSWLSQPMYKVLALIVSNIFYTIPICIGFMTMWYVFALNTRADWDAIFKATALCVVCVVFITHTYETVFLIKSWETDKTKSETLERAKAQAELEALKNQIDPHFMFNSLNTLSHLIDREPAKAKLFNDNLAEVFRYILSNKERNLVLLTEELAFAEKYFSLIRIRFGAGVALAVRMNGADTDRFLVPPISLQVLLENAIKHNEFSERTPLLITAELTGAALTVSNTLKSKRMKKTSSHIGLHNLNERYKLTTEREIAVEHDRSVFRVTLPLLSA